MIRLAYHCKFIRKISSSLN